MKTKWKVWLFLLSIFLLSETPKALALTQEALVIKVSISAAVSFTVDKSTWNFGAMAADSTSVSTAPIVVSNNSGGLSQTYRLQFSTPTVSPAGWLPGASWNTTTAETFVLGAQFSTAQPANADGSWGSDIVTTSLQSASSTVFGNTVAGESGQTVPNAEDRSLWFRIETPATTADPSSHDIYVTLSVQ